VLKYEAQAPSFHKMTITTTLTEADGGTDILIVHDRIPGTAPVTDNEAGTRMALAISPGWSR
jgi:hypothetical protein